MLQQCHVQRLEADHHFTGGLPVERHFGSSVRSVIAVVEVTRKHPVLQALDFGLWFMINQATASSKHTERLGIELVGGWHEP